MSAVETGYKFRNHFSRKRYYEMENAERGALRISLKQCAQRFVFYFIKPCQRKIVSIHFKVINITRNEQNLKIFKVEVKPHLKQALHQPLNG